MAFSMIPMGASMVGFTQFQKMLGDKGQLAVNNTDKELGKLAFRVQAKATEFAPVDTGRLRASIIAERIRQFYWLVGTNVKYAQAQEFGSSRNPPHPYLRPSLMAIQADLRRLLARADILRE